jgi:hypothetical protein
MALYALTASPDTILRTTDGAFIPTDPSNADYVAYLDWQAGGGVPDAYVPHIDTATEAALKQLLANDATMFRGLEVLIDVLLSKGTIVAADFPPAVRNLYQQRKALRTTAGVP